MGDNLAIVDEVIKNDELKQIVKKNLDTDDEHIKSNLKSMREVYSKALNIDPSRIFKKQNQFYAKVNDVINFRLFESIYAVEANHFNKWKNVVTGTDPDLRRMKGKKAVDMFEKILEVPSGFTKSKNIDYYGNYEFKISNEKDAEVIFRFHKDGGIDGTHNYKNKEGKEFTTDRVGVESGFYYDVPYDFKNNKKFKNRIEQSRDEVKIKNINEFVKIQIDEAIENRDRVSNYISVPDIGFSISQDHRDEITRKLKSGGTHSFLPSGFGTGYRLSPHRSRYAYSASEELKKFFDVKNLYIETSDHD